jgi:hypothetical protein
MLAEESQRIWTAHSAMGSRTSVLVAPAPSVEHSELTLE